MDRNEKVMLTINGVPTEVTVGEALDRYNKDKGGEAKLAEASEKEKAAKVELEEAKALQTQSAQALRTQQIFQAARDGNTQALEMMATELFGYTKEDYQKLASAIQAGVQNPPTNPPTTPNPGKPNVGDQENNVELQKKLNEVTSQLAQGTRFMNASMAGNVKDLLHVALDKAPSVKYTF